MKFTKERFVRASDLAKLTVCEQKAAFENQLGERLTPEAKRRIRSGNSGHARYLQQAFVLNPHVRSSETKPWCFVASAVFGQTAPETIALRRFRDAVLRKSLVGRAAIRAYYRVSPAVARFVGTRRWTIFLMRMALVPVISIARWVVQRADK